MVENHNLDNFRQFRHFLNNFYFCEKFFNPAQANLGQVTESDAAQHNNIF